MRFLHTADWHLGKTLRGRSRISEQEQVLAEILEIAVKEKIDALLVSGDIYDSQAPSPESERLVFRFFSNLIGHRIAAVLIAGNHDHPRRLGALRPLLEPLHIFVRAEPAPAQNGGVIELVRGNEKAVIAALPFVSERKIIDAAQLLLPERDQYTTYEERLGSMSRMLCKPFSTETVNILLGHLYLNGAETSGSERAIHISKPYEIFRKRLPSDAHYIGLGHLHRPQSWSSPSPVYYAGSTVQLDFGEQGQEKRVVVIDASAGESSKIETIPLTSRCRLLDVTASLQELQRRASEWQDCFLRVTVQVEAPTPGIADQVRRFLPQALDVRLDYPRDEEAVTVPQRLGRLTPEAMFSEYYRAQHGAAPAPPLIGLFRDLYEEVSHETD